MKPQALLGTLGPHVSVQLLQRPTAQGQNVLSTVEDVRGSGFATWCYSDTLQQTGHTVMIDSVPALTGPALCSSHRVWKGFLLSHRK